MTMHITLAKPLRVMLQNRSVAIVAFDGESADNLDEHAHPNDRLARYAAKFVTSAVYPSGGDAKSSPQPVKIKTTLYLNPEFVVGAWPQSSSSSASSGSSPSSS
jgi:hypothetical protein